MSEQQREGYGWFVKKNPILGMLILLLAGTGVLYYSSAIYKKIRLLEQGVGESVRVPRFVVFIYEILGIWGVVACFILSGLYIYYKAYDVYRKFVKKQ